DLSWEQLRYRSAADYAAQARAELPSGEVRASLGVMVAEAYFHAGDYGAAAEAYGVALNTVPEGVQAGTLMSQLVTATVLDGRLDEAARLLDSFAAREDFGVIDRWQTEWTLVRAFQTAGRDGDAYARVNRVLSDDGAADTSLPDALHARL